MLTKLLLFLVLLYFIARSARNLWRAALHDAQPPPRVAPHPPKDRWQGPAPSRSRPTDDVEDARWVDL